MSSSPPVYFAASATLLWRGGDPRILAGIYALAVLPTTVSSAMQAAPLGCWGWNYWWMSA